MISPGTPEALFREALVAKEHRRARLARLPFEEKLGIVVELQRLANVLRASAGRPLRPVWGDAARV
ncbi:MAG: hypothetical protein HY608_00900 [Planctomycetes bacterium]|nr:hypothetical protein [Planctomycetota bacterium]